MNPGAPHHTLASHVCRDREFAGFGQPSDAYCDCYLDAEAMPIEDIKVRPPPPVHACTAPQHAGDKPRSHDTPTGGQATAHAQAHRGAGLSKCTRWQVMGVS